jgi:hypothetical protein
MVAAGFLAYASDRDQPHVLTLSIAHALVAKMDAAESGERPGPFLRAGNRILERSHFDFPAESISEVFGEPLSILYGFIGGAGGVSLTDPLAGRG